PGRSPQSSTAARAHPRPAPALRRGRAPCLAKSPGPVHYLLPLGDRICPREFDLNTSRAVRAHSSREVGVFQVHGIDVAEKVVVRKRLRRRQVLEFFKALPPCLIGMEACATAHYWARELTKLGHRLRLMPAKDVKAYVKRNKNDAADAEAICEAVQRPTL